MGLERDCWYWVTTPHMGGWTVLLFNIDGKFMVHDRFVDPSELGEFQFQKIEEPTHNPFK